MRAQPIAFAALIDQLADLLAAAPGWLRVAVDAPAAADPDGVADALVGPLRLRGREVVRASTKDHLRPASLRLERGRDDPDSFYEDWLDEEGLRREVLNPLEAGGTGRIRPVRWDAAADRARREGFIVAAPGCVLVLSGPLLLGRGLPFDLTVHLAVSAAALRRRTPAEQAWTLPAYQRYTAEVDPARWADVVVRFDDPRHPALVRFPETAKPRPVTGAPHERGA